MRIANRTRQLCENHTSIFIRSKTSYNALEIIPVCKRMSPKERRVSQFVKTSEQSVHCGPKQLPNQQKTHCTKYRNGSLTKAGGSNAPLLRRMQTIAIARPLWMVPGRRGMLSLAGGSLPVEPLKIPATSLPGSIHLNSSAPFISEDHCLAATQQTDDTMSRSIHPPVD